MKRRTGNCPACAAPVEFKLSTALVTVCDFCNTVVARGDKKLEDHGKVADLVETNSPLSRGMSGKFENKRFEVVGRVQYQHPAGGVWNEWYLQFPADRVGWLAEAQGKFYIMSRHRVRESQPIPDYDDLTPGQSVNVSEQKKLIVAEKGVATALAADGSIPWAFRPRADHRFADLHGAGKDFATIEYGESGPTLFVGREVSLAELNLTGEGWEEQAYASPNTSTVQVNCPHCAGPLTLHAPDQTLRVCCPSCHSLLDCEQGKLQYLQTLHMEVDRPVIPLGAVGKLFDVEYTVIGFMVRFAEYQGRIYPWSEYLLYQPTVGFRWLVCNKKHWSFVEPIPVSSISNTRGRTVTYNGKTFSIYDRGTAYVRYVAGEFYWRVTAGESVETADYIAPPQMISSEKTESADGGELNLSLGTYVPKEVLEVAFGLKKELKTPWGIGPIQPRPSYADVWIQWFGFGVLLFVLNSVFTSLSYVVDPFFLYASLFLISLLPIILLIKNYMFEVSRWEDSDFSPYATQED